MPAQLLDRHAGLGLLQKPDDLLVGEPALLHVRSFLGKRTLLTFDWYALRGAGQIDNNACENAIRPFCVGRRNWLFADTVAGAHASANLYSLLQTCLAYGIDGYRYLRALLVELPKATTVEDFEALLPWQLTTAER